ncbi:unnamed protein product [Cyprideis torosa]|uniref:Uncharacterized protein n=1 Tax=Cyprideis torosa TaxID=163714 RepID=A0A7R8WC67_9CRUS|nr:unnamed protein product [Cyprideis torosa]CAG0892943.1 unnamed protein product [Cyprideis torosa]
MKGASEIRNLQLLAGPKLLGQDADRVYTVKATVRTGRGTEEQNIKVSYSDMTVIGNGSFGVVYKARLVDSGEYIAIKKVQQDMRFKNRELPIMKRLLHPNIVEMKFFFYTSSGEDDNKDSKKKPDLYLNLALEYLPDTLYNVCKVHAKSKQCIPLSSVALYSYQLFRSLAYLHSLGICHRDIKPQNLLLNRENGVLKLCDFGSAKRLVSGEANVAYICSRYYRAPELIFGATFYSSQIDVWSSGCVIAEMLLGQPVFPGGGMVDQLVEIIKVLGTPSKDQHPDLPDKVKPSMDFLHPNIGVKRH